MKQKCTCKQTFELTSYDLQRTHSREASLKHDLKHSPAFANNNILILLYMGIIFE